MYCSIIPWYQYDCCQQTWYQHHKDQHQKYSIDVHWHIYWLYPKNLAQVFRGCSWWFVYKWESRPAHTFHRWTLHFSPTCALHTASRTSERCKRYFIEGFGGVSHLVPLTCSTLFPGFWAPGAAHSGSVGSGLSSELWRKAAGVTAVVVVISPFMCMAWGALNAGSKMDWSSLTTDSASC